MANIATTQKDSIVDQLEQLHQRIARRAYDLFRGRDGWGDAFGDWFSAEKADYQNGMLNITVAIAQETPAKRVDVKAA